MDGIRRGLCVVFWTTLALQAAPPEFDSYAVSEAMIPMRDGVKLATGVYIPAHGGKAAGIVRVSFSEQVIPNPNVRIQQKIY